MPQPAGGGLSKDVQDSVLLAMLNNPEHATNVAAISDDELNKIDSSVPPDDKQ